MSGSAVAERQDHAPANVEQHPTDMLAMIERMAVNPNIDPAKLEKLIAMKNGIDANAAKIAFTAAFVKMAPELPRIEKRGRTDKADYGKWEDIQDAILPVLSVHGFALSFKTQSTTESVTVTAILRHEQGHEDSTDLTLSADKGPGRNNVQAIGSSVSYGKRYAAEAILNLRVVGQDDDGRKGGGTGPISDSQRDELLALLSDAKVNVEDFCKFAKIDALSDLPAAKFDVAKQRIQNRKAKTNV